MAVFQNRPYERHMVTNVPTLLATGLTLADLAVGQIGIFDAKTNRSVTAPTYAVSKAIYIAQGTPDRSNFPEGAGVPNVYRKTHEIRGKEIKALFGKKANRGQSEIVTLGYDGVDLTKTLTAKPGETFYYYVRLTGDPIFNLNPDQSKGVIITGAVQMPCADDCSDNCGTVDCSIIVDGIIKDFNQKLLPGGQKVSQYVKISPVLHCEPTFDVTSFTTCTLGVPDNGTAYELGLVQAQAPGAYVIKVENGVTTYGYRNVSGCPSAFVSPPIVKRTDCATCDLGTFLAGTATFEVKTEGFAAGDAAAIKASLDTLTSKVSTVTLLQHDPLVNVSTYKVVFANSNATTTTAAAINTNLNNSGTAIGHYVADSALFVGASPATCTIAGTSYSWTNDTNNTCTVFKGTYKLTLRDSICGTTWATQITADYITPGFATNLVTSSAGDNCTHEYTMDVYSNCTKLGCSPDEVTFPVVPAFQGGEWTFVELVSTDPAPTTSCACGVQFESIFVPRVTKPCTFGYFAYQTDFVHIEASSHNPDWRSTDICENDPAVTRIQNGTYPNGAGQAVARLEKDDRMYDMDYFYLEAYLREAFDFYFETNFDQYYDQIGIEYEFNYSSNNGFGQYDHDRYRQSVWMPEGQGGALVTALNTYAASALVDVEPIVL